MIKFHLDENVDHAIAHGLRLRGIDVTTATDANLIAAADPDHIAFALTEGRVIFTQDQDFSAITPPELYMRGSCTLNRARTPLESSCDSSTS